MAWSAQEMNPNLKPDDLLKLGVSGREKVITQFILPAMRNAAPLMPKKSANDQTMRGFGERALDQGFTVETILLAVKNLPERFEAWPSWLEFHASLRSFQHVKKPTQHDETSSWFIELCKMTQALIDEHGREKVEELADRYSQGVYDCPLVKWADFKENIIRLFINDRMKMGAHSSMDQIITYAKTKLKATGEAEGPAKPSIPATFVDKAASYDKF